MLRLKIATGFPTSMLLRNPDGAWCQMFFPLRSRLAPLPEPPGCGPS